MRTQIPAYVLDGLAPAELLRETATQMLADADAATPGPWKHMCMGSDGCLVIRTHATIRERGRGRIAKFWLKDWHADHADAEFVSRWDPEVARSIAAWLEVEAAIAGRRLPDDSGSVFPALRVARAYLRLESTEGKQR